MEGPSATLIAIEQQAATKPNEALDQREIDVRILKAYLRVLPGGFPIGDLSASADLTELAKESDPQTVLSSMRSLLDRGYLIQEKGWPEISPEGVLWLSQNTAGTTFAEIENLAPTLYKLTAHMLISLSKSQQETGRLQGALNHLGQQQAGMERRVYSQAIPILAVFVAIIAIVVTAAQAGARLVATGDPLATFLQTLALIGVTAACATAMVLVIWLAIVRTQPRQNQQDSPQASGRAGDSN